MRNIVIRLTINFIISAVVIMVFRNIDWIRFDSPPHFSNDVLTNDLIVSGIIGFVIFLIGEVAGAAFQLFVVLTCGTGCLLYPVFVMLLGYIKLVGAQFILQDWFSFDNTFIKVVIISIAVGIFRIPSFKKAKKIVIHQEE